MKKKVLIATGIVAGLVAIFALIKVKKARRLCDYDEFEDLEDLESEWEEFNYDSCGCEGCCCGSNFEEEDSEPVEVREVGK